MACSRSKWVSFGKDSARRSILGTQVAEILVCMPSTRCRQEEQTSRAWPSDAALSLGNKWVSTKSNRLAQFNSCTVAVLRYGQETKAEKGQCKWHATWPRPYAECPQSARPDPVDGRAFSAGCASTRSEPSALGGCCRR